jgi:hypothetical protein
LKTARVPTTKTLVMALATWMIVIPSLLPFPRLQIQSNLGKVERAGKLLMQYA